jgi:hypothetical protein
MRTRISAIGVVLSLLLLAGCGRPARTGNADVATMRSGGSGIGGAAARLTPTEALASA